MCFTTQNNKISLTRRVLSRDYILIRWREWFLGRPRGPLYCIEVSLCFFFSASYISEYKHISDYFYLLQKKILASENLLIIIIFNFIFFYIFATFVKGIFV